MTWHYQRSCPYCTWFKSKLGERKSGPCRVFYKQYLYILICLLIRLGCFGRFMRRFTTPTSSLGQTIERQELECTYPTLTPLFSLSVICRKKVSCLWDGPLFLSSLSSFSSHRLSRCLRLDRTEYREVGWNWSRRRLLLQKTNPVEE